MIGTNPTGLGISLHWPAFALAADPGAREWTPRLFAALLALALVLPFLAEAAWGAPPREARGIVQAPGEPLLAPRPLRDPYAARRIAPKLPPGPIEDQGQKTDEPEPAEEIFPDYFREQDNKLKRLARVRGMRMRALYGPEIGFVSGFINSQEESGIRQILGITTPITETWEAALLDHLSWFSLKSGSGSAARDSIDIRIAKNPAQTLRPWLTLTPYFNFADAKGEGLGLAAGVTKTWRNGANLTGEIYAWRPWDEGYYTIIEDGRKHGVAGAYTLPFTRSFILSGRAWYEELELGPGAKSGEQYAGHRYGVTTRAYYRLIHREGDYMGYGFRNDELWNELLVGRELGVFASVDFQRYFKPSGFKAFNPVEEVCAQDVGIAWQYAFTPHLGFFGEAFIGQDPDRGMGIGERAGANGRLLVVVNPHLRLWVGTSLLKTNNTLESSGGEESVFSFGINYTW